MATKRKTDPYVRCFEVSEPKLHEKGHTIYKVTLKAINVDVPEDDVVETVVWKRYNDFKKLYKAMSTLHKALHRSGEFPPFARAKLFGRFDDQVITERQQSAQDLLNFVGQRHYLVSSKAFKQFFEGGEKVTVNPHSDPILEPLRLSQNDTVSVGSDTDLSSIASSEPTVLEPVVHGDVMSLTREELEQDLGGVWQYRQAIDNISLDEDDEETDFTDDSTLSTPLPETDMSFFDPLCAPPGGTQDVDDQYSNLWLLSALSACEDLDSDGTSTTVASDSDSMTQSDLLVGVTDSAAGSESMGRAASKSAVRTEGVGAESDSEMGNPTASVRSALSTLPSVDIPDGTKPSEGSKDIKDSVATTLDEFDPCKVVPGARVSFGHGDSNFDLSGPKDVPTVSESQENVARKLPETSPSPSVSPRLLPRTTGSGKGSRASSTVSSPSRSPRRQILQVEIGEKGKYIVGAAKQISLAQQCEANGNYHMAFTYYKNGVGVLLTGVQGDDNRGRREVVRRKTARYLLKAEEIYNTHLAHKGPPDDNRWDTGQLSPSQELTQELDPQVAHLQGPVKELNSFRVLGVISSVMLVLDKNTNNTYVMKVLHKASVNVAVHNIVPCQCPYMVRLHRFYETDSSIYLLLQHATGGRLWTYVSGFIQQQQEPLVEEAFSGRTGSGKRRERISSQRNVYTGYHLHEVADGGLGGGTTNVPGQRVEPQGAHSGSQGSVGSGSNQSGSSDFSQEGSKVNGNHVVAADEAAGEDKDSVGVDGGDRLQVLPREDGEGASLGEPDQGPSADCASSYTQLFTVKVEPAAVGISEGLGNIHAAEVENPRDNAMRDVNQSSTEASNNNVHDCDPTLYRENDLLTLDESRRAQSRNQVISETRSDTSMYSETSGLENDLSTVVQNSVEQAEGFEELLKESAKPSLENFSINSFDSDSAPGSIRFDSTTSDYIESIPELNEASPRHSGVLVVGPSPTTEEVFLMSGGDVLELSVDKTRPGDSTIEKESREVGDLITGSRKLLNSVDLVLQENDSVFDEHVPRHRLSSTPNKLDTDDREMRRSIIESPPESEVITRRDPVLGLEIVTGDVRPLSPSHSMEEVSIYDIHRVADTDGSGSLNVSLDRASIEADIETHSQGSNSLPAGRSAQFPRGMCLTSPTEGQSIVQELDLNSKEENEPTTIKIQKQPKVKTPPSKMSPTKRQQRLLMKRLSGERSLEMDSHRSRKRNLSGVFGELDLAEDSGRNVVHLPEGCVRQWAAEMVVAVASLHSLGIICRDLRPGDILLGERGHILLTYFCRWNCVPQTFDSTAISHLYAAPEVSGVFNVTPACDWWSIGVLLFELFTGQTLVSCYPGGITSHTTLIIPEHVSPEAQSLLSELLRFNPTERLGSGINGAEDVKHHPFFHGINWNLLQG